MRSMIYCENEILILHYQIISNMFDLVLCRQKYERDISPYEQLDIVLLIEVIITNEM